MPIRKRTTSSLTSSSVIEPPAEKTYFAKLAEKASASLTLAGRLTAVRERIEKGWCQKAFARTGSKVVEVYDPSATRWCLVGAVQLASGGWDQRCEMENLLSKQAGIAKYQLSHWNDAAGRTKEEVLALVKSAIANVNNGPEVTNHEQPSQTAGRRK